ncbi:MAG: serine/threonine protein kinase [Deltaproteobacteria bacterium]|nr:MAG: serine/threonine protein kinase [Deltaproteobacteria bacterium]
MSHDPFIGHTLSNQYRIERFSRQEELAKVYEAVRLSDGEIVDIKLLPPHQVDNRETVHRFAREMLATATLQHPNTVAMLDYGDDRLYDYVVLEHIKHARSLEEVLEAENRLDPDRVAHVAAQIASALAAAHSEGIIHRNLSASTVLLVPGAGGWDLVKIRDFGYARLLKDDDPDVTAVGSVVGSPETIAPEYINEGRLDPRGDLYALGVLMWWMLIGHPPFTGKRQQVLHMHTTVLPSRPSELRRDVPTWMDDLVWTLLAKHPEARPSHARDLVRILEDGIGHALGPPEALGTDAVQAPASPQEEKGSGVGWYAAFAVIAVILLGIVGALAVAVLGLALTG